MTSTYLKRSVLLPIAGLTVVVLGLSACGSSSSSSSTSPSASPTGDGLCATQPAPTSSPTATSSSASASASTSTDSSQVWNFVTEPNLHPNKVTVNVNKPGTAPGLIFTDPYSLFNPMVGQTGKSIADNAGNSVWFQGFDSTSLMASDFRPQIYNGQPVLTWWQGTISSTQQGYTNLPPADPQPGACYYIMDNHYNLIKTVQAQNGFTADVHEFLLTDRGTAYFTVEKLVPMDLSQWGGPTDGVLDDYAIQEVDVATGKLLFSWDFLDKVSPSEAQESAAGTGSGDQAWDAYHANSISEDGAGNIYISARNTWTVYKVEKATGNIVWRLGGKQSDFKIPTDAQFYWQHDARWRPQDGNIGMFDDGCCATFTSTPNQQSHGLILKLNEKKKTVKAVNSYYHDPALNVVSQGNLQALPNGNQFTGWGQDPYYSEYAAAGNTEGNGSTNLLYDAQFPGNNQSYRAYRNPWVGHPDTAPKAAVRSSGGKNTVYASWNGSTETVAWQVLAGPSADNLSVVVDRAARSGFETTIDVPANGPYFQVKALDASGKVLNSSAAVQN